VLADIKHNFTIIVDNDAASQAAARECSQSWTSADREVRRIIMSARTPRTVPMMPPETERDLRHRLRVERAVTAFRRAHPDIAISDALLVELLQTDRPEAFIRWTFTFQRWVGKKNSPARWPRMVCLLRFWHRVT
jgi:hypothetical protein